MPPRTCLFKNQSESAEKTGIGGTIARIGIVKNLFCKIERTDTVQRFSKIFTQRLCEYRVNFPGQQRVLRTYWFGRLKKIRAVGAHLMKIGCNIGIPPVMKRDLRPAFGM